MLESLAKPNSAYALNLRDASKKHTETDLFKKPSFTCRRENQRTWGNPRKQAWTGNHAHKRWDRETNLGLIGAKQGKIRNANLLPLHLSKQSKFCLDQ